ncbi:hypothetical protein EKL30_10580 [Candidimonas sp. SYP-B2681]|uniref:hypothetical protein n=1 Tax=Candidimonas sp. SYP-B2681 TaxID=2497686 RepID=UPI000F878E6C|nr:hypothetical protein [Candidimonas sp. SYP-B2681]RTZ43312.1 hypothetical protein EKL30_10580 [Candidimonas sp. SYP-B2681]
MAVRRRSDKADLGSLWLPLPDATAMKYPAPPPPYPPTPPNTYRPANTMRRCQSMFLSRRAWGWVSDFFARRIAGPLRGYKAALSEQHACGQSGGLSAL